MPAGRRTSQELTRWLDDHADVLDDDARAKRASNPLRVFDVKSEAVREALRDAPKIGDSLCADCAAHFAEVRRLLDGYGVAYTLEPTLVRGLDYYTRTVFEFVGPEEKAQSSICSGGRYDGLVEEIGGPPTPGDRLRRRDRAGADRAPGRGPSKARRRRSTSSSSSTATAPGRACSPLLAALRRAGLSADTDYAGRSFKGQMTQAGRTGAETVVVVRGEDATIRRRGSDEQVVALDRVVATLTSP